MAEAANSPQLLEAEVVVGSDGVSLEYRVALFEAEDSSRIEVIVVGKGPSFFLVAVPGIVWDRN